ncbi:MAG: tail fiber domain-containing protein [Leptospiraceae bacterium]|nr:tail fiber domain-containing protein [Leptospiraceae bacterium]
MKEELKTGLNLSQQQNNNNTCSDRSRPITTAINPIKTIINNLIEKFGKGFLFGIGFSIGIATTSLLAVAVTGTVKSWTTGEVLSATDLNTTISSLKTAIEGITSSQWTTSGSNISYTAGNVGIGTNSPGSLLTMNKSGTGAQTSEMLIQSNGTDVARFGWNSSGYIDIATLNFSNDIRLSPNGTGRTLLGGFTGIGTTNPSQNLTVNGNAGNSTGVWVNNSDLRLKKNIEPLSPFLDRLVSLRPVTFEWKVPKKLGATDGKHIGFIAQEVEKIFPNWVDTDKTGYKWLNMEGVNAAFVRALQELVERDKNREKDFNQKISKLEEEKLSNAKKISTLEEENKKLQSELISLRNSIVERDTFTMRLEERLKAIETMQMAKK